MPKINQQEIARILNLSQTTVSRALANHSAINAETKARVWSFAAENGYRMPTVRSGTSRSTTDPVVVGVIIAIPKRERGHAETSQLVLRGIADAGSNENVTLDVIYQEPAGQNTRQLQKRIRQSRWKGCLLIHPMAAEVVETISRTVPCVSVVENYRMDFVDSVDVDQIEAFSLLVRYLHEAGHRDIGFVTWVYDVPAPWVYHRFGAYAETIFQLGLSFDPRQIFNIQKGSTLRPESIADLAVQCIQNGTTAFLCAADHQAYELRHLLQNRGLRIPDDCSITGFDGLETSESQITTVRVPYAELGRASLFRLLRRINTASAPRRHVLIDGEFVEGESVKFKVRPSLLETRLAQ